MYSNELLVCYLITQCSFKMANSSMPIERLQALDNVEKEIASCIQSAGMVMLYFYGNGQ